MPVPLIIDIEKIRSRMNFDEGDEAIETVMMSAVTGMVSGLGAKLRTQLASGTDSEVFCLEPGRPSYGGTYRLMLRNGFVRDVVVTASDTLSDAVTPFTPLSVDLERGILVVPDDVADRKSRVYLRVQYGYGFVEKDPTMPEWLSELALCYSVQLMAMHQLNDPKAETNGIMKVIQEHSKVIIDDKFRSDPRAIRSIM